MATKEEFVAAEEQLLNEKKSKYLYLGNDCGNVYLTKREVEVLRCTILGYSAKSTAKLLNISFRTVECYIDNIKLKLRCNNKRELIGLIIKSKVISLLDL